MSTRARQPKPTVSKVRIENPLVRILASDKAFLDRLAADQHQSIPEVLNTIIEKYRRQEFFDDLSEAYAELRANPEKLAEEVEERRLYESSLLDGFKEGE